MKHWAQFYHLRGNSYAEGVGDRQMVYLDGRHSRASMEAIANGEAAMRGYDGYRIARGNHISTPFYLNAAVKPVLKVRV